MWRTPRRCVNPGWVGIFRKTPQNPTGQTQFLAPLGESSYTEKYELIDSDDNQKQRTTDKYCAHYKRALKVYRANVVYAESSYARPELGAWTKYDVDHPESYWGRKDGALSYPYGGPEDPERNLAVLFTGNVDSDSVPLSTAVLGGPNNLPDLGSLVDASLSAMLPGIRPSLSLVNSILELKDVKSMARQFVNLDRSCRRFQNVLKDRCPWYRRDRLRRMFTLRNITRSAASGWLSWSFAYMPMVSDMIGVIRAMADTREQVRKLLADEGKEKVQHFAAPLFYLYRDADQSYTTNFTNPGVKGQARCCRYVRYVNPMFRAAIRYRYTIPGWAKADASLRGLLDGFGVNLNPAIVWNAIPYSFMLDWVLGVGRWLDQFKVRNLEPKTHITRYCISYRVKREIRTTFQVVNDAYFGTNCGEVPVNSASEDAYVRMPMVPDLLRSITSSGLSSREFSLASALAITRWW